MIKSLKNFYKTQEKLLKLIKKNQYIECSDFTNYIDHLLQLQDRGNIKVEFIKNTCKNFRTEIFFRPNLAGNVIYGAGVCPGCLPSGQF